MQVRSSAPGRNLHPTTTSHQTHQGADGEGRHDLPLPISTGRHTNVAPLFLSPCPEPILGQWLSGSHRSAQLFVHGTYLNPGGAPRAPFRRTSLLPSPVSRVSSSRLLLPSRPPYLVGFRFWSALDFLPLSSYLPLAFSPSHSFNPPPLPPPPSPPPSRFRIAPVDGVQVKYQVGCILLHVAHRPSAIARRLSPGPVHQGPRPPSPPFLISSLSREHSGPVLQLGIHPRHLSPWRRTFSTPRTLLHASSLHDVALCVV